MGTNRRNITIKCTFLLLFIFMMIGMVSAVGTYPSVDPNMVLYYHFNNDSSVGENYFASSLIYDYSNGHLNNGTANNTSYNSSSSFISDGSLVLNGINSSVYLPTASAKNLKFDTNINFSISLWIKASGVPAASQFLVAKDGQGTANSWDVFMNAGGQVAFRAGVSNQTVSTVTVNDSTWHYVVAVATRNSTNGLAIYIDGVQSGTIWSTLNDITNMTSTNDLYIGRRTGGNYFNGSLDDIIIYNRTLNQSEIWSNYQSYNGGCFNVSADLNIYGNTTLCQGNHYNNDSNVNGVVIFKNNGITLDCNGSNIIGNWTDSDTGIFSSGVLNNGYNDTIIKNCNVYNYYSDIWSQNTNNTLTQNNTLYHSRINFQLRNADYFSILNSNITLANISNIYADSIGGSDYLNVSNNLLLDAFYYAVSLKTQVFRNAYFYNNTFNHGGFELYNQINAVLDSNLINNQTGISYSVYGLNTTNLTSKNNNYKNINSYEYYVNSSQLNILNNTYYNCTSYLCVGGSNLLNFTIENISTNLTTTGIYITNGTNGIIRGNIINNSYLTFDGWLSGMRIEYLNNNITIDGNRIINSGCEGILLRGSNNTIIKNNYFNKLSLSSGANIGASCYIEPNAEIFISELYKSWYGDSTEANITLPRTQQYRSYNISISNNTYGSNSQVYLRNQGGQNVTHDLTNYQYRKFQIPNNWVDPDEFYIEPNFNNLSIANYSAIRDIMGQDWKYGYNQVILYRIHSNFMQFIAGTTSGLIDPTPSENITYVANNGYALSLFNLTSPTFSNGTLTSGTYLTNTQANLTLSPGAYTYVS